MTKEQPAIVGWEEPPPEPPRKGSKWDPVANLLRANPGRWAKVVSGDSISVKSAAVKGGLRCFQPAGSFEGRVILKEGHRWIGDVWLRYIGENGEYA